MPGMDGVEICRRVRRRQSPSYIYLILLTAKDRKEDVIAGLEAGADDYLIKPFDPHELQVRLRAGQRILDLQAALLTSLEQLAQAHQREVEVGAKIQQTLLLGQPPAHVAGVRTAALTIPSQHVDGDFYDFFQHGDRCFDVVVGDVMGKGVPAALLGAAIKSSLLRALSHLFALSVPGTLPEPEEIVMSVHRELTGQFINLGIFATLCYARFDLARHRITIVDCGHTKTVHFRRQSGKCEVLEGDNMPLGFSEEEIYRQVAFPLAVGDTVVFYSDGVTETRNAAGECFGVDRLVEVIEGHDRREPGQLIDAVRRAASTFAGTEACADDFTCVVLTLEDADSDLLLAHAQCEVVSDVAELPAIRAFVRGFCQGLPATVLDDESLDQLELAVAEAATNIMRHAYQGRADQRIHIAADAFGDRIAIQFFHRGAAFDPEKVRPPVFDGSREGGFGVYIITHSVDEVRYECDARGKNSVCLVKKRRTK
jgi:sigma-B regulation protein RsbU (phosphoserine phosphatase)